MTDRTVHRIFKVRSISNLQSSKDNHKLMVSAGVSKMVSSPSIWQYDTALIADKMKYKKSN
jgi:hypothetical protein